VDFLPGLVAPRVGVFVTELGQQTNCVLYFLVFIFIFLFLLIMWCWNIKRNIANVQTSHRTY